MPIQVPFPIPSHGFALNSKLRVNLDFIVSKFNEFNSGSATWDTVAIGAANSLTGSLTLYNNSNAYYLTFQPGVTAANTTFTLPTGVPAADGAFIKSTTGGVMSFSNLKDISSITGNQLLYIDGAGVMNEVSVGSGHRVCVNSTPPSFFELLGTSNQIVVTTNASDFTLSTPQDIGTSSNVAFGQVALNGGTVTNPSLVIYKSPSATNTGLFSTGSDIVFTCAGSLTGAIDSTGLAMQGEIRGDTSRVTSNMKISTGSSGIITIQALSPGGGTYTLTLPVDDGSSNEVLTTDGSGNLSWAAVSSIGGANNALSNLASVAINTTLVSDTDNTDDLGTSSIAWKDIFLKGALKSGGSTLATITELGYLSGVTSAIQTQFSGKASTALSNLASVAINTTLVSDTNNTDDLGSDSIEWKDTWTHAIKHNDASNPNLTISTTGNNGNLLVSLDGTGQVGISTASPLSTAGGLDISSGGFSLVLGADNVATTRTDATTKNTRIASAHYTNAEEPIMIALMNSSSTDNTLSFGGGASGGNTATIIRFLTAANQTTLTGTERMRIASDGTVGIATTSPITTNSGLDIASGGIGLVIGATNGGTSRSDSANKTMRIGCPHYTNSEEPMATYLAECTNGANTLYIGGGTSSMNASTEIRFYTASGSTTTTGTQRGSISGTGSFIWGTAALGTTATDGFVYIPSCNGAPSGTPTAATGRVPMIYDTSTNNFYIYNGAWKKVLLA